MRLLTFLALLSFTLAAMGLCGCVTTRLTTPEGLELERTAFYSDFAVKASRAADGSMKVEETQDTDQAAATALLQILKRAAGSAP